MCFLVVVFLDGVFVFSVFGCVWVVIVIIVVGMIYGFCVVMEMSSWFFLNGMVVEVLGI